MPIRVKGPDGTIAQFPDGTPPETIKAAMAKRYGAPKRSLLDNISGAAANFNEQVPFLDEVGAAIGVGLDAASGKVRSLGDVGKSWDKNRKVQKASVDDFNTRHPNLAALSRGTGLAATVAAPAGQTTAAFSMASRVPMAAKIANAVRGATIASAQAGASAFADKGTLPERVQAASKAVTDIPTLTLGALSGGALPVAKTGPKVVKAKAVPVDELQKAKTAAYKAVENSGITFSPQAFDGLITNIAKDAASKNLNPMRHPKAASMIAEIEGLSGSSPTLNQLDQLRQVVRRDVVGSTDPAEKFFGRQIIDQIDLFIEGSGAVSRSGKGGETAGDVMALARDLNSRFRKTQAITEAVEKATRRTGATYSGGNIDNAIRQRLLTLREKTPNLTDEEKAAFDKVILGGGRVQNTLRTLGKLSPQGNGLMTALSIGGTMANPALGIPTVAGAVSKTVADAMTKGNVDDLLRIVSTGGASRVELEALAQTLESAPATKAVNDLRRAVAAKLAGVAGAQGGMAQTPSPMPTR